MIVIPAGEFTMGSPATEKGRSTNEGPQHKVTIAKPFAVSKFDVTFADWDACVSVGGCIAGTDRGFGRTQSRLSTSAGMTLRHYVAWLSKMTGQPYRLLTEAEWEYAARAGTTTAYYWGDDIGKGNANCNGCGSQWDATRPHRSDHSSPMRSASTTWPATCGNGCRIAIIVITMEPRQTVQRGPAEIAPDTSPVGGPQIKAPGACERPTAALTASKYDTSMLAFVLLGRSPVDL